jgi:hypothetical protein
MSWLAAECQRWVQLVDAATTNEVRKVLAQLLVT